MIVKLKRTQKGKDNAGVVFEERLGYDAIEFNTSEIQFSWGDDGDLMSSVWCDLTSRGRSYNGNSDMSDILHDLEFGYLVRQEEADDE